MKKISDRHKTWMKDPEYRKEFLALEEKFAEAAGSRLRIVFERAPKGRAA
jgi:hypothetical protein